GCSLSCSRGSLLAVQVIGLEPLDQSDFSAGVQFTKTDFIHESPYQEYPTAGLFQKVLRGKRVGDFVGNESFSLVGDSNNQFLSRLLEGKVYSLGRIVGVAVQHGVNHPFTDRHGDSAPRVFIEAGLRPDLIGHLLGLVHALQRGFQPVRNALWRGHQRIGSSRLVPLASKSWVTNLQDGAVCLFGETIVNVSVPCTGSKDAGRLLGRKETCAAVCLSRSLGLRCN